MDLYIERKHAKRSIRGAAYHPKADHGDHRLLAFSLDKPLGCAAFTESTTIAGPGVDMSIQCAIH